MRKTAAEPSWIAPGRRLAVTAVLALSAAAGCTEQPKVQAPKYSALPPRDVPAYMTDTVMQYTDMTGTEPFPVSGYGLVANLHGTGGSKVPTPVRDAIAKDLMRNRFGELGSGRAGPDTILDDRNFSIVQVDAAIPPGARCGTGWATWFDVHVSALPESTEVTSLAHGDLWTCELKINGANPAEPGGGQPLAEAEAAGPVFINPKYVLDTTDVSPDARASRVSGVILNGAGATKDRPLYLRLRSPERRLARAIERRIVEHFQDVVDDDLQARGDSPGKKVANAQDEAEVDVYVPKFYKDNWGHFAGVVNHLYMNASPAFATKQAKVLADAAIAEAAKPDPHLLDISYAWEGLGKPALYAIRPFLADTTRPALQYAAARAAGFIGEPAAIPALLAIANTPGNAFRGPAVDVLAALPQSPQVDHLCRALLDSDEATVRIAAYNMLRQHKDPSVRSRWIKTGDREVFALDVVRGSGKPMVYCTRQGASRVAVFGLDPKIVAPFNLMTLDERLTMNLKPPESKDPYVELNYRDPQRVHPATAHVLPDLPDVVAALAGDGEAGLHGFQFGYADVVAILQAMVDKQGIGTEAGDQVAMATFVLQNPGQAETLVETASFLRPLGGERPASASERPSTRPSVGGGDSDGILRGRAVDPVGPVLPVQRPTASLPLGPDGPISR